MNVYYPDPLARDSSHIQPQDPPTRHVPQNVLVISSEPRLPVWFLEHTPVQEGHHCILFVRMPVVSLLVPVLEWGNKGATFTVIIIVPGSVAARFHSEPIFGST